MHIGRCGTPCLSTLLFLVRLAMRLTEGQWPLERLPRPLVFPHAGSILAAAQPSPFPHFWSRKKTPVSP